MSGYHARTLIACMGIVAIFASACVFDGELATQRQQAAAALERWAADEPPPPWDPYDPPLGLSVESVKVLDGGRSLVAAFTGAPNPGTEPCGIDYEAEAVESDLAVVIIILKHPHSAFQTCPSVGAPRTATVQLAAQLGDRTVLEVREGRPVPFSR